MSKEPIIIIDWLTDKYVNMEKWFVKKIIDMIPKILDAYFWISKKEDKECYSVDIFIEDDYDMDLLDDGFLIITNEGNKLGIMLEWKHEKIAWVKLKYFNTFDSKDWKKIGEYLDSILKDGI